MKRQLNPREKIILVTTVALFAIVVLYNTFLRGFIEEYRSASGTLTELRQEYLNSQQLLTSAEKVDRDYEAIAASLSRPQSGKTADMLFTEEMAALFRRMNIPTPTIRPATSEPVPGIPGFSYLILNVEGISGDLAKISAILMEFHKQGVLIQKINIKAPPVGNDEGNLAVNVELAQIVRSEELGIEEPGGKNQPAVRGSRSGDGSRATSQWDEIEEE